MTSITTYGLRELVETGDRTLSEIVLHCVDRTRIANAVREHKAASAELERWLTMDEQTLAAEHAAHVARAEKSNREEEQRRAVTHERCWKLLVAIKAWEPPAAYADLRTELVEWLANRVAETARRSCSMVYETPEIFRKERLRGAEWGLKNVSPNQEWFEGLLAALPEK